MEKRAVEITKAELGDVISAHEHHTSWLFTQKTKTRNQTKRREIDTERNAEWSRIHELNAIFDTWPWPDEPSAYPDL